MQQLRFYSTFSTRFSNLHLTNTAVEVPFQVVIESFSKAEYYIQQILAYSFHVYFLSKHAKLSWNRRRL
jgi:hypothetical protein